MFIRKTAFLRIIFYIIFFLFFILLSQESAEAGSLCAWYNLFGFVCPGCGTTRAFTNFMHFDFIRAFMYNPMLTLLLAPWSIFIALQDIYIIILRLLRKTEKLSIIEFYLHLLIGGKL
ncbi:MAG: hypothetical protein K0S55_1924 [Clostridia bacterium]|nr:hypothetical protein [Clostridia bacterium]